MVPTRQFESPDLPKCEIDAGLILAIPSRHITDTTFLFTDSVTKCGFSWLIYFEITYSLEGVEIAQLVKALMTGVQILSLL